MLVQFCFFGAYGLMSIPAGRIVKWIGFKKGIMVGLAGAALGCLMFYPAAAVRSYGVFLFAFFVLATGIVILQVAANPFVAVLGKPETASSRLTLTQAFNSLATWAFPTFIGPIILAVAGLSAAELAKMTPAAQQAQEAQAVQLPYVGLALALALLSVIVWRSKLPKIDTAGTTDASAAGALPDRGSAWSYRHLVLGAVAIFVYVGAEVAIGSLLVNYFKEPYTLGLAEAQGSKLMARYWLCAMVGRFIGSLFTLRKFKPGKVLAAHAVIASLLVVTSVLTTGWTAVDHHHRRRPAQLGHVPDDLHAGDRRPRPPHRAGLGHPVRGDRGRRLHPGAAGRARRQRGPAHQLRAARRSATSTSPGTASRATRRTRSPPRRPPPADHFDISGRPEGVDCLP